MATIANLAVSLTAKIGNYEKGFKKAQRIARNFGRDLSKHIKTIASYGAAIVGVASLIVSRLVKGQLSAVDSTAKLARVMGIGTEELVGYQHAIELAGGSAEGLDKAIIRMNRTIADAQSGLSTAIREIQRAGLSVEDLAGLSTDQRIQLLADRYNQIGDAAGRASFLLNVFGRQGTAIGTLFENGSEGIRKARMEAEELGLTFSALDGSRVEEANDAVTRLGRVITGVARRITIQLAPFIEVVSNRLRDWALQGNVSGEVVVNAINYIATAAGKLADILSLVRGLWNAFVVAVSASATGLLLVPAALTKAWNKVFDLLDGRVAKAIRVLSKLAPGGGALGALQEFNKDSGPAENLERFFDDLLKGFTETGMKAAKIMDESIGAWAEGANADKVQTFFEAIKLEAQKASDVVKALDLPDVGDGVDRAEASKKAAQFLQVDLRRVAIGGVRGGIDKSTKQRQDMISVLKSIDSNTRNSAVVV